jgi:hypothetical protein
VTAPIILPYVVPDNVPTHDAAKTPRELDTEALDVLEGVFREDDSKLTEMLHTRAQMPDGLARRLIQARVEAHERKMNALARAMRALRECKR